MSAEERVHRAKARYDVACDEWHRTYRALMAAGGTRNRVLEREELAALAGVGVAREALQAAMAYAAVGSA